MFIVLTETWQQFHEMFTSINEIRNAFKRLHAFRNSFNESLTIDDIDATKGFGAEVEDDDLQQDDEIASRPEEGEERPVPIDFDDIPPQVEFNVRSFHITALPCLKLRLITRDFQS